MLPINNNLVNNKDFYRDFMRYIRDEAKTIKGILDKHILDRELVIKGLSEHFKSIKGYYIINGYYTYNLEYFQESLRTYTIGKPLDIRPIGKVGEVFAKHLTNKLKRLNVINYKIKVYSDELKELDNCKLDYKDYCEVSGTYNEWCMKSCLDGGDFKFATRMGKVCIYNVYRDFNAPRFKQKVDHHKSQQYKKYLIANGKIPFKKEDADRAAALGLPYDGEEWLIYFQDKSYPFIKWHKGNRSKTRDYTFVPNRSNNLFKSIFDAVAKFEVNYDVEEMFSWNLGFVNNLHILKHAIPGYMNKFPNTLFKDVN